MLEKIFKLKDNKTTVFTEFIAGLTTFMAISYIIFINPSILSLTGMDYNSVYVATILASAIGTFLIGVIANVPYVQSAGLGLNALFTYTICGTLGFTWQQGLAMVLICGVINVLITGILSSTFIFAVLNIIAAPYLMFAFYRGNGLLYADLE